MLSGGANVLDENRLLYRVSDQSERIRLLSSCSLFPVNSQRAMTVRQTVEITGTRCGLAP